MAVFAWGVWRHISKYRHGSPLPQSLNIYSGIKRMVGDVLSHRTLRRRDTMAGLAHAGIFLGFLLGFIGTALIFLETDILKPLFGVTFWKGWFYLGFSLSLDLGHLAAVLGIIYMMWRRGFLGLSKLDYMRSYRGETDMRPAASAWKIEDWCFISFLLVIELTGFTLEAARILVDQPPWAAWSPVGNALAGIFAQLGMSMEKANSIRSSGWWLHGLMGLAFTAAIPLYKGKHILSVLCSLTARDPMPLRRLPKEAEDAESAGVSTVSDFTWKDMLHFDSCTKCGRCHDACPARTAGYPLSPRDLILDLRLHNDKRQGVGSNDQSLIGDVIDADTLWACRTCGACQEICPVGIEHPSIIVRMRRQLVDQGNMDPLLQTTLGTIGDTGNSFGENSRKRSAWTRELEFKVKDIREEAADNLWFVGDYASFDPRNQKVSQSFAGLMKAAGTDFALLHEAERTAGNDVRRTGEEGLFESLVEQNLESFTKTQPFTRIITTDPHSYNTLKNEYPEFGDVAPIEHYSSVLADLLRTGRLKVTKPLNRRVTFHDPCHLGRLNGGYEAPREVLRSIGCEIIEMPRNRDNSFCCGAGGGRIWIPDQQGTEKPSENRVHEAAALGPIDVFVTCCPKDLTMFEDARKTGGHEDDFIVQDLAELVAEAVELNSISLKDMPSLAERITDAVAIRIADVVAQRIDKVLEARLAAFPVAQAVPQLETVPAVESVVEQDVAAPSEPASDITPVVEAASPESSSPTGVTELKSMSWDNMTPVQPAVFSGYQAPPKDGPRILVTVKHAAILGDEHAFTSDGRDILPEYLEYTLNEWDDAALEEALLTIEKIGSGEVVVIAIGPEDAEVSLRKVLAKGADRAVRVWDDNLACADPVIIARAIAGIAQVEQPDLIFTGVQSSDHAHGTTGTALARILGLPHSAVIIGVEWDGSGKLSLVRELESGTRHLFELPSPAVLAIQTGINVPRYATMRMIKQAKKKPLDVVDGSSVLDGTGGYVIRKMYVPEQTKAEMFDGSPEEVAALIANVIRDKMGE
ncbi:MAG: 4Fe-4S dicluster domain-containing protein [Rhodospirillales bacterium]|nr:4Fe-4S dicluster domain-containing protein [Rhodospirillales bacterium]